MNEIVIISDIHLGSDVCQVDRLYKFLDKIQTQILIINGDLFDSWDFRRLRKDHWKILKKLRQLSDKIKVVWISGNHDGPAEMVSHLIGVDFVNEYLVESGHKKMLVLHGDIFDNFISKYPMFTKFADKIYRLIQRYDRFHNNQYYYSNLAKRNSKTFLRCSEQIADRALQYCKDKNCDFVICGHTHAVLTKASDMVEYYNCGCWTESVCSFITINSGNVEIKNERPI
jgi:UDP-2,3-diacylglucosamine pyrophosphatase LpxH